MKRNGWLAIVTLILGLVCAGVALSVYLDDRAPLAVCSAAVGIVTFFYFAPKPISSSKDSEVAGSNTRTAMASAIVVQYLVLVGLTAFLVGGEDKLSALTQMLLTSFTTVVGVVLAFYFGSSAYIEAQKSKSSAASENAQQGS